MRILTLRSAALGLVAAGFIASAGPAQSRPAIGAVGPSPSFEAMFAASAKAPKPTPQGVETCSDAKPEADRGVFAKFLLAPEDGSH